MPKLRPTIPEPLEDLGSLRASVLALKEAVEIMMGQRGSGMDASVTWNDLITRGIAKPDQKPGPKFRRDIDDR